MIIFICPITFEPLKMGGLCIKMVVIPSILCYIFVLRAELKLKDCTSISYWLFHFISILVAYRDKSMKLLSVSKYIWT